MNDATRILQERARRLAERQPDSVAPRELKSLICFSLCASTYALHLDQVSEVLPLRSLTPIPGAPPVYCGVAYVRGGILPIIDSHRLLALPEHEPGAPSRILRLAVAGLDAGLLVDGEVRFERTPLLLDEPPFPDLNAADITHVEGISTDGVVLLNFRRLADDPRLHSGP